MASVKAKLTVVLKADETIVAESVDAALWQQVFLEINSGGRAAIAGHVQPASVPQVRRTPMREAQTPGGRTPVDEFARQLGIERDVLIGACSPTMEAPFLQLDVHCWQEMKKKVPPRGPFAMGPIVVPATMLVLWFRVAALGNATYAQAEAVLETIGVVDHNARRGVQRAEWLQTRAGGVMILNPAEVSHAVKVVRSFCTKEWSFESVTAD